MSFTEEEYKIIVEDLKSDDIDLRRMSAEDLGYSDNENAAFELINYLNDEDKSVRDAVAEALKKVSNEKACYEIVKLLSSNMIDVRNYAVDILTTLNEKAIPSLIFSLDSNDYDIRKFAVDILGNIKATPSNKNLILMLNDPNDNVLVSVIEALGNIGSEESVPHLIKIVNKGLTIKATIIEALGKIRSTQVIDFVLTTIDDDDSLISFLSIETMGKIGNKLNLPILINYISLKNELFTIPLLISILRICNRENISILDTDAFTDINESEKLLKSLEDLSIRKHILENFENTLTADNIEKTNILLDHFDKDIKVCIIEKLKENYSSNFENIIIKLLTDRDSWIIYKASTFVGENKILNAEKILLNHLESDDELILISSIKNLGKIKSSIAKEKIIEIEMKTQNEDIKAEIKLYLESI